MLKDKKWFTPVRFSHLSRHAGAGAIIRDQNDWLVIVKDISAWPERKMVQLHAVERVKKHLGISSRLLLPPVAEVDDKSNLKIKGGAIPTARFPSWTYCGRCNVLHFKPWLNTSRKIDEPLPCSECKEGVLEQVTWCAVSSIGGLKDIPWHYLAHRNTGSNCPEEKGRRYLKIVSGDRGKLRVECTKCNQGSHFEQADFQSKSHCQAGEDISVVATESTITYTVMSINDPRVYTPSNASALVIPPESNIDRNSLVYKLEQHSSIVSGIKNATRNLQKIREIKKAIRTFRCTEHELVSALAVIDKKKGSAVSAFENTVSSDKANDEYFALITPIEFHEDADFITRSLTQSWREYVEETLQASELKFGTGLVDRLVAVDRLRVIEIFKGFERKASDYEAPGIVHSPDFTSTLDWLPAIELFGEGIFFTLDNEKLSNWESNSEVRRRAQDIEKRLNESGIILSEDASPTARFIMLHTLAHLVIRELESASGYPASSLKERIFCSEVDGMAGILIYTAVPDIAGSLGGIVELARPAKFARLLDAAFRQAEWCSLDPVCGEMEGQGPGWLNRAACHGCALVPDTSCSYNNVLLDRVFIKGKPDAGVPALIDVMGA